MAMTKQEYLAKQEILKQLSKEGYPTYAGLLDLFHVNLTSDPGVVAYMEPGKGRIVVNRGLNIDQVSTIVRHEILHEYLNHHLRLINHIAKSRGLNPDDLTDDSIKELEKELYSNKNFNIAGDYEISNRGYTERDKNIVRNIKLNGEKLSGLVTEDDHPEWVDLSIEDMYDKLQQELEKEKEQAKQDQQDQGNSGEQGQDQGQSQGGGSGQQDKQQKQQEPQQGDGGDGSSGDQQDSQQDQQKGDGNGDTSKDDNKSNDDSSSSGSQDNSKEDSKEKKKPSIGDKGDQAKQDAEELERQANDISKELEKSNAAPQDLKDKAKDVADDAKDLSKDISKSKDGKQAQSSGDSDGQSDESGQEGGAGSNSNQGKDGDYAQRSMKDDSIEDRLEKIKRAFNDVKTQENAINEIENNIQKERAERSAKDLAKYRNSPMYKFTASLNKFMKREVAVGKDNTWKRFNKKYQDSGIYKPGRAKVQNGHIPSINVYFDRSGSWDEAKTKVGAQAIATLNNYVRKGQIKINLYYFSRLVHSDQESCYLEGSTYGQPIMDHIEKTKPDNVIIMTDADIKDITKGAMVPGVVWLLFKGGRSENLINNLHGKKATELYDLE